MKRTIISALLLVLAGACGGGGGHSPTEQPQIEQVAGTWRGLWLTSGLSVPAIMTLSQSGSSLSGTVSVLESTFNITGAAGGTGITWSVPNSGCGSLTGMGTGANLAPAGFADPERARFRRHPHPPLPDRMNRSVAFTV